MNEPTLRQAFDERMRTVARALRAEDGTPADLRTWRQRRAALQRRLAEAMGPAPETACALEPRVLGTLKRAGYRIEKLIFQSRPDVWVTGSLYLPDGAREQRPAVLCVHGHWRGARRDPTVQARCIGLAKLGFVALVIDAFGAGERYTSPRPGAYHGSLYGSTLWPSGHTLLGMQVHDNRRAVDYLISRPEVDGRRLGITGASGGGNQTMYAGALDERFGAVVPVCSVGNYQAYLRAACCVCEVLPGALRFTEEGDVLGLVAPRALMVVSATRDAFQFSVDQARISLARAQAIYRLHGPAEKVRHAIFESPHDYSRAMREAMYGWMTRWLKNEGKGEPIPEPKHEVDAAEDLACFPAGKRPERFLLLPEFAGRAGAELVRRVDRERPDHAEAWEAAATARRSTLRRDILGEFPPAPKPQARLGKPSRVGGIVGTPFTIFPEPALPVPGRLDRREAGKGPAPACLLLHPEGQEAGRGHALHAALLEANVAVLTADLRATGSTRPERDAIAGAPDHNSAEHALWVGRPLLGQWVFDIACLLDWLELQPGVDRRRIRIVGVGAMGVAAAVASAHLEDRVAGVGLVSVPLQLATTMPYPAGFSMGLLAPGILRVGDMPHLAALSAPRRLVVAEGVGAEGKPVAGKELREAFTYPRHIYRILKAERDLVLQEAVRPRDFLRELLR